jgi:hypothetical protein
VDLVPEVVVMTVLVHRTPHTRSPLVHRTPHTHRPLARWAWLALALVPVGWVVALAAALDADPDLTGGTSTARGAVIGLVALAAPTAAVILSDLVEGAGGPSGRMAVALSGILLFLTIVGLPRLLVSVPAFVIALALGMLVLSIGLVLARRWAEHADRGTITLVGRAP